MRAKTKTQPKSQHTQANHPGTLPHPPLSLTHPPLSLIGGTPRTGCASLALGRGGRAGERRGEEGAGARQTHRENRFCLRHGERRRGSVLRLPEPPAQRPLRSRSTAAAPRRGAGSSPPPLFLLLLSFFFFPSRSLSLSPPPFPSV